MNGQQPIPVTAPIASAQPPSKPAPSLDFVIHIIESPSSDDFLDNRQEGRILLDALSLGAVEVHYYAVIDRAALKKSFERIKGRHSPMAPVRCFPIVHISAHGNSDGIRLTGEREMLKWKELGDLLADLNGSVNGVLLVCMSTCLGFNGFRMAYRTSPVPFYALVGPTISPTWPEALVAYQTFYHLVACKKFDLSPSVEAMNTAAGRAARSFLIVCGEDKQKEFQQLIAGISKILAREDQAETGATA